MNKCLRAHHGMCFQFYEGKGYSADFTDRMGRVIKELEADPEQKVVLKACGLRGGSEISFAEFIGLVREKIIDAGIRGDICGDCSWEYICREKKSRYEDSE